MPETTRPPLASVPEPATAEPIGFVIIETNSDGHETLAGGMAYQVDAQELCDDFRTTYGEQGLKYRVVPYVEHADVLAVRDAARYRALRRWNDDETNRSGFVLAHDHVLTAVQLDALCDELLASPSLIVETTDTTPGTDAEPINPELWKAIGQYCDVRVQLAREESNSNVSLTAMHALHEAEIALRAALSRKTTDTPKNATQDCRDCDGCGWNEGGPFLKNTCATCQGSGRVPA